MLSLEKYFQEIESLMRSEDLFEKLNTAKSLIIDMNKSGGRLIMAGNGASANIVSHGCVDFTKQAKIPAINFHDPGLITAFSNDYGYENWVLNAFKFYRQPNDILLCVSVSGESPNITNACKYAKENGHKVISFSGKSDKNSLMLMSDLAFFVDSEAYNIVEGIHMIWLTSIIDMIIGDSVYAVA